MSTPRRHHFVPSFYLTPWAGADGKVCQMRRVDGIITAIRKSPKSTGFEEQLYRTDGVSSEYEQHLELKYFSPLDNDASVALKCMMSSGIGSLTPEMRLAWTRYVLSLKYRTPETIKDLKEHMQELWIAARESIKANYPSWRLPTDPATFEEMDAKTNPATPAIGATNLVMKFIDNRTAVSFLFKAHWTIHSLKESSVPLLTSDSPLEWHFGTEDPRFYTALPIAPNTVFIASVGRDLNARWGSSTAMVKGLNRTSVVQAREYVWGTDSDQLEFVRKYFGSAPRPNVLTDDHKEASMRVVRGETNKG